MVVSKKFSKQILKRTTLAAAVALGASDAFAQSTSDIVFIVDESGSLGGEQAFLQTFVPTLDQNLNNNGIQARYGLVGFGEGGANDLGVIYDVGGGQFGNAAQFSSSAAANLDTSGSFEDGYSAIDVAVRGYNFNPNSSVVLVIVTDEDRDNGNNALNAQTVQAQLAGINGGATLVGIVDADITGTGGETGIGTDGTNAFIVDMAGNVAQVPLGTLTSSAGATEADYIAPALASPNGCIADLNQLRAGGAAATGFANVFNLCLAQAAISGTPANLSHPLLSVIRDIGMTFARSHSREARLRMDGLDGGGAHRGAGYQPQRGEVLLDAYGFDGLRMFIDFRAADGDFDSHGNNAGFDYDGYSISAGIDKSFTAWSNSALVGVSLNTTDYSGIADGGLGNVNVQGYGATFYGGIENGNGFYGDAHVGYSMLDIDSNRINNQGTFSGDTDGSILSAGIRIGYDFPARLSNPIRGRTFSVGPYASVNLALLDIDSFGEDNNGLTVSDFDSERLDGEIGLRSQLGMEVNGATAFVKTNVGYRHDLLDDGQTVGLTTTGGATGSQRIDASNESAFVFGLGLGAAVNQNLTFALEYDGQYGDDIKEHGIQARLRLAF